MIFFKNKSLLLTIFMISTVISCGFIQNPFRSEVDITTSSGTISTSTTTTSTTTVTIPIVNKSFCVLEGATPTQKIQWSGLPTTPTCVSIYYFTNSFSNDDLYIDLNGKYNQKISATISSVAVLVDPAGEYAKADGTYYITLNNGSADRRIFIWKISWGDGEILANDSTLATLSGGASISEYEPYP